MLIVEDGTGIYGANSYAGLSFAQSYLTLRNRVLSWNATTKEAKEAALIAATDFIDKRYGKVFSGQKQFTDVVVSGYNYLSIYSQPAVNDTVTIGLVTYTFSVGVAIGATIQDTLSNLKAAIDSHPLVNAEILSLNSLAIYHKVGGEQEPVLTTSSAPFRCSWDYRSLIGGSDSTEQILEWPRLNVHTRSGVPVSGIPEKLRQATVEYASRALDSGLMPDPVTSDTGQDITHKFEKVGPIEDETFYSSQVREIFKKYPEADKLLSEYLSGTGGVIR